MRRGWRWAVNTALAALALAGTLTLAEVAIRTVSPQPMGVFLHDPYGLVMHWPGLVQARPQYGQVVSFNSAGMRDREHALEKAAGTYRILVLGDSFMEALQVPFERSLPSLLEHELQQSTGRSVEVINAGVSGWGTDDELRYLTSYGMKWRPDLVVVTITLHNDISDNLRQEWHTVRDGVLVDKSPLRASFLSYKIVQLKAFAASRFQLYQLWRKVRYGHAMRQTARELNSHVVDLFREPVPERIARGFELTGLLLRRIQAVAGSGGARVAVALLPLRVQITDRSFADFIRRTGLLAQLSPVDKPQRSVERLAAQLEIPLIDLLPAFRQDSEPLFIEWDGHWNEAGHRLAAHAVVTGLLDAGLLLR